MDDDQQAPTPQRFWPTLTHVLLLVAAVAVMVWLLLPRVGGGPSWRRETCTNNMRQLVLALHHYAQKYRSFPPAYVADANGKPMHSWRVLILPFLGEQSVYKEYDFSEPWNGPHNSRLLDQCPDVFRCPSATDERPSATNYVAVVGDATVWPGEKCVRFQDIRDGMSNTIALVEVGDSGINWMEPSDVSFDQAVVGINVDKKHGIHTNHAHMEMVSFADGSVRCLPDSISPATLRAILTIAGGETVYEDQSGNLVGRPPKQ
jgi:hypothetical protein